MNKEIKEKWVAALRSGNYEQGRKRLQKQGKFCCLGVLCDLHAQETDYRWMPCRLETIEGVMSFLGFTLSLPIETKEWSGFELAPGEMMKGEIGELVKRNDEGQSFEEIADWIEENL